MLKRLKFAWHIENCTKYYQKRHSTNLVSLRFTCTSKAAMSSTASPLGKPHSTCQVGVCVCVLGNQSTLTSEAKGENHLEIPWSSNLTRQQKDRKSLKLHVPQFGEPSAASKHPPRITGYFYGHWCRTLITTRTYHGIFRFNAPTQSIQ